MDVLVVDDEADIRDLLSEIIKEDCNYSVSVAQNASSALSQLSQAPKVVILDIWLEGSQMDGIGLLKSIKAQCPSTQVIMISGHGNVDIAIKTIKLGAYDFLEKPFKTARLLTMVKRAMDKHNLIVSNSSMQAFVYDTRIVGSHRAMTKIKEQIDSLAKKNGRILIVGERGVGKQTVARAIHNKSERVNSPFFYWQVCGKTAQKLLEELQGSGHCASVFELANGGSLFINELLALPRDVQSSFLSILQSGKSPSDCTKTISVRVIAATKGNLEIAVRDQILDHNLYANLSMSKIEMLPLRELKSDIPELVQFFIHSLSLQTGIKIREIEGEALSCLIAYHWHSNIRQLRNVVEWMMLDAESVDSLSSLLTLANIPDAIKGKYVAIKDRNDLMNKNIKEAREIFEKIYIESQLQKFDGNISKTAAFIGMDRAALHRKIKLLCDL